MKTIDDVRAFWEGNPLWEGESRHPTGSPEFFTEHRAVCLDDCFAGRMDERIFPTGTAAGRVLDLGCGIGFWTVELGLRGARDLTAVDLTDRAVELTRARCAFFGVEADVRQGDAERLPFADGSFAHVNCQGVIHHTPDPDRAVAEIARVLEPGGTASISVYYRNAVLRLWPVLRHAAAAVRLRGRKRGRLQHIRTVEELVRTYDGAENPIGLVYTRSAFEALLRSHFEVEMTYLHFFPARTLPVRLPGHVHRLLDRTLGFMIYANVRKPEA
jgi:SAM-dependent methyltransferase